VKVEAPLDEETEIQFVAARYMLVWISGLLRPPGGASKSVGGTQFWDPEVGDGQGQLGGAELEEGRNEGEV
jgi:ABC-type uncharacterized transport system permease subunit